MHCCDSLNSVSQLIGFVFVMLHPWARTCESVNGTPTLQTISCATISSTQDAACVTNQAGYSCWRDLDRSLVPGACVQFSLHTLSSGDRASNFSSNQRAVFFVGAQRTAVAQFSCARASTHGERWPRQPGSWPCSTPPSTPANPQMTRTTSAKRCPLPGKRCSLTW